MRKVTRLAAALALALATTCGLYHCGRAAADLLQCPYPATGFMARVQPIIGEAIGYICNYPVERNLSHLRAEYGGYMTGGGTLGFPGSGGGSFGTRTGVGLILWSQSWRCPDERYIAAPPNGIGGWKDPLNLKGVKCPAVERAPLALNAPWPPDDPNIVVVVNQVLMPGQPDPTAAPPGEAPPMQADAPPAAPPIGTPAILDPVPVNPVPVKPQGQ